MYSIATPLDEMRPVLPGANCIATDHRGRLYLVRDGFYNLHLVRDGFSYQTVSRRVTILCVTLRHNQIKSYHITL